MKPLILAAPCKDYLWGGNRLREYGKQSTADKIAESWELSCHSDGESIITNGVYAGRTLTEFLREHPEAMGKDCKEFTEFPVLIKLIDAYDNLSVQVHPDDAYAMREEGGCGKTELWYIVDAEPGASLIYGFKEAITKEEFRASIANGTLLEKVNIVPVQKGDVFFIPAGTLHAIGKGILIAEIQQNSNLTYRVYDYGRIGADGKPRQLHIEKALDVTTLTPPEDYAPFAPVRMHGYTYEELASCTYFQVYRNGIYEKREFPVISDSFQHILVLDGEAVLRTDEESIPLQKGMSVFVPAGMGAYEIQGRCNIIHTLSSF